MTLPPVDSPAPPARASRIWTAVGVLGELLITLGVLLLLLVAYQLWWTNVVAERQSDQIASQLRDEWLLAPTPAPDDSDDPDPDDSDDPDPDDDAPDVPDVREEPEFGSAFALMYIPRLRSKVWGLPVLHSVALSDLARGIGHYPESQLPGRKGNFAVAGHRATNGEPLRDIDRLRSGDLVYVETRTDWFVYELTDTKIVTPTATWVVQPVPGRPGAKPTERLITITTCNPRWASYERWIWWGRQVDRIDKDSGRTPAAILEG